MTTNDNPNSYYQYLSVPSDRTLYLYESPDKSTRPVPCKTLAWSGDDCKDLPPLHSIVQDKGCLVTQGVKCQHLVIGYFEEEGFLGLVTLPFDPPQWWLTQGNKGKGRDASDYCLLFGVDIDERKTILPDFDASEVHAVMLAAGVTINHHETDLYVPLNVETSAILSRYEWFDNVSTFRDVDNRPWFDIPFAYLSDLEN